VKESVSAVSLTFGNNIYVGAAKIWDVDIVDTAVILMTALAVDDSN